MRGTLEGGGEEVVDELGCPLSLLLASRVWRVQWRGVEGRDGMLEDKVEGKRRRGMRGAREHTSDLRRGKEVGWRR